MPASIGVAIPETEGTRGMAAIVCEGGSIWPRSTGISPSGCPPTACRFFFGSVRRPEITGTFKYAKTDLVRQGFNPSQCGDPLYFNHPRSWAPTSHSTHRCTTASSQERSNYELGQRRRPDTDTTLRPQVHAHQCAIGWHLILRTEVWKYGSDTRTNTARSPRRVSDH